MGGCVWGGGSGNELINYVVPTHTTKFLSFEVIVVAMVVVVGWVWGGLGWGEGWGFAAYRIEKLGRTHTVS